MNRIVLIGNGFDLAHGLDTSYKHFIDDFWARKAKSIACNNLFRDEDDDIELEGSPDTSYKSRLQSCNNYGSFENVIETLGISFSFNNDFLKRITTECELNNWVDVEKEFYNALKECLEDGSNSTDSRHVSIDTLNKNFGCIKESLRTYLIGITQEDRQLNGDVLDKMVSNFSYPDFSQQYKKQYITEKNNYINSITKPDYVPKDNYEKELISRFKAAVNDGTCLKELETRLARGGDIHYFPDLLLSNILLLNFNYTDTCKLYCDRIHKKYYADSFKGAECTVINIHGELESINNPMIFGFGDEIDDDYSKIENLDDNRFLENIKSTKYHETDNYKRLLEYIDSDYFQIFIFGHSCGLSDRTMLSTLFNHDNCVSIKPFYYKETNGNDNYSDLVRNISRHFKNKASLRNKVVNKTYCFPLTGSK